MERKLQEALDSLQSNMKAGGADPDNERRRAESLARDREREGKPRTGPKRAASPTGQQRVLSESGGRYLGIKYRLTVLALQDPRLKPSAKVLAGGFFWRLQSARVFRLSMRTLAADLQIPYRTAKLAMSEMKASGYLLRHQGGWVCPALEAQVPPEHRAYHEQLSFEFAREWDRLNAGKHLQLVEPKGQPIAPRGPVDNSESATAEGATHCPMRGNPLPHEGQPIAPPSPPNLLLPLSDPGPGAGCGPSVQETDPDSDSEIPFVEAELLEPEPITPKVVRMKPEPDADPRSALDGLVEWYEKRKGA